MKTLRDYQNPSARSVVTLLQLVATGCRSKDVVSRLPSQLVWKAGQHRGDGCQ